MKGLMNNTNLWKINIVVNRISDIPVIHGGGHDCGGGDISLRGSTGQGFGSHLKGLLIRTIQKLFL